MIDLTPLDVRKKRGDFPKGLRGYDPQEVDTFLELVAERLEEVVKENMTLRERSERLTQQVEAQTGREQAVQDALVTAQQLREEIKGSAERERDLLQRETESEARRIRDEAETLARGLVADAESQARAILADSERALRERHEVLSEMERRRARFLNSFRQLLERELDVVHVEEGRSPLDDVPIDLDLLGGRPAEVSEPDADEADFSAEDESAAAESAESPNIETVEVAGESAASGGFFETPVPEIPESQSAGETFIVSDPPQEEDHPGLRLVSDEDAAGRPLEDADVHGMAGAAEPEETADMAGKDEDNWLDEILESGADEADRRRDEGER